MARPAPLLNPLTIGRYPKRTESLPCAESSQPSSPTAGPTPSWPREQTKTFVYEPPPKKCLAFSETQSQTSASSPQQHTHDNQDDHGNDDALEIFTEDISQEEISKQSSDYRSSVVRKNELDLSIDDCRIYDSDTDDIHRTILEPF